MQLGDELGQWIYIFFDIYRPKHRQRWRLGDEPSIVPTKFITGDEGGRWRSSPGGDQALESPWLLMQHCIELIRYFDETKCYICTIINYVYISSRDLINDLKIVINNVLGKISWNLRRSTIVLFTLFCTFFKWKLKFNLVSNIIPRCLWVIDDLTKFLLK